MPPAKPYPDFPLFPHASGQWAKKIRGRTRYFGLWADWQAALNRYLSQRDALYAGEEPRVVPGRVTLRDLCNHFATAKTRLVKQGELSQAYLKTYLATCRIVLTALSGHREVAGLTPLDLSRVREALSARYSPVRLKVELQRVRGLFRWGYEAGLLDAPLRLGSALSPPSLRVLRLHRGAAGERMFDPAEIHVILAASKPPLTTMILLGLNCGFGNHDCAMLTVGKIDIARPWIAFARPKTGVYRECPLWSETAAALAPFLDGKGAGEHVFLRPRGGLWFSEDRSHSPIAQAFCRAQKAAGVYRLGRGFYSLRHTFETVGGEAKDQATVDYIMGHAPHASDMSAVYRERMLPERLLAVTQHVHDWLYAPSAERLPAGHPPDGQPDCAAPQAPRP